MDQIVPPEPSPGLELRPAIDRALERLVPTRRSSRAATATLIVLALVASVLFILVVKPFWAPLLLAAVLAAVFQRPLDRLARALRGRRTLAAMIVTTGVFLAIVLPFGSIAAFAAREAASGFTYLRDTMGVRSVSQLREGRLPPALEAASDRLLKAAHLTREQLHEGAARAAQWAQDIAPQLLASSGRAIFSTIVMLLAFYFLLLDGRKLIRWLWNVSPLQAHQTEELLTEFHNVSVGSIVGTVASALIQGVVAGAGFVIFGVPRAIFFGLLTVIASFIPIIGTAIVWVPAVALLAISGHQGAAVGLGIWCLIGVVGIDQFAKPLILRGTSGGEMHTGLLFLSLLGGLEVFGLLGVVLGPLVVSLFVALMRIIEREARGDRAVLH